MPKKAATSPKKGKSPASAKMSTKYKKAPDAPKRFKSAFIIFSAEKHKEIKKKLEIEGRPEKTTDIAKLVSESWKQLSPEDREEWEVKAEQDRARYEAEKANYKGPWKIPAHSKRSTKDPAAPKRPMSAFLAYSNSRRAALKRKNPKATNADLSKMLSKSWKELPADERAKYMAEEAELRAKYKSDMAVWRKKAAKQKKDERVHHVKQERAPRSRAKNAPAPPAPAPPAPPAQDMGNLGNDGSQLDNEQQLQELMRQQQLQMQQQQEQLLAEQQLGGNMGNDPMSAMRQQDSQQLGGQDGGLDQQQLGSGSGSGGFFAGSNPYSLQAGLGGGFPGGMDAARAAFGLNSGLSSGGNPYLANALANQAYMQGSQGGAGSLSALMNQNYLNNPMSQLPQQGLNQGFSQSSFGNQGLNPQGFYGNQLGGYGGLGGGGGQNYDS